MCAAYVNKIDKCSLNLTIRICYYRYCELVEQHHPKDLLALEEFLTLRKQVITKPAAPLTIASSTDDDDTTDAAAADDLADDAPPGVDDQAGSDADLHGSDNKSKVCTRLVFDFVRSV